jgi:acetyltransferase
MVEPSVQPAVRTLWPPPDAASLERVISVKDGDLVVRPIRHEDAPALIDMIHKADPADVRSRFHVAMHEPPPELIERLTDIDYSRHMALIALSGPEIVAVARLVCDPGCGSGEFALAVRTDQQRRGIGRALMRLLLDYARGKGMETVWGNVEVENHRMLALASELGFHPVGAAVLGEVKVTLTL